MKKTMTDRSLDKTTISIGVSPETFVKFEKKYGGVSQNNSDRIRRLLDDATKDIPMTDGMKKRVAEMREAALQRRITRRKNFNAVHLIVPDDPQYEPDLYDTDGSPASGSQEENTRDEVAATSETGKGEKKMTSVNEFHGQNEEDDFIPQIPPEQLGMVDMTRVKQQPQVQESAKAASSCKKPSPASEGNRPIRPIVRIHYLDKDGELIETSFNFERVMSIEKNLHYNSTQLNIKDQYGNDDGRPDRILILTDDFKDIIKRANRYFPWVVFHRQMDDGRFYATAVPEHAIEEVMKSKSDGVTTLVRIRLPGQKRRIMPIADTLDEAIALWQGLELPKKSRNPSNTQ